MPKQTESQKIGSLGHSIVEEQLRRSKFWIVRDLTEDYGIDIELEFAPDDVKGKFVKAQIKSHEQVLTDKDFILESLPKSFLRYVYECRVPIILIVVSTSTSKSWFVWLQKWILDSDSISNIYNDCKTKTLTIFIHKESDFILGLQREIVSIATWENSTQVYIAVRDLANLSLRLYDDKLSQLLFSYIEELESINETNPNYLDSLIKRVIELGTGIWATSEGNKVSQLLFKFIREYGDKLNANHVSQLVIRGDSYSRTGIIALGVLYDNYPQHASSLKLPNLFEDFSDPRLHYYCVVRERSLGEKGSSWFSEGKNLTVGKLKADFSEINTSIYDKWANRGDSAILDYVVIVD